MRDALGVGDERHALHEPRASATSWSQLHAAPTSPPLAATLARDPHHDAASRWCAFARGVLERLIDDANRLRAAILDPRHPLHAAYRERELAEAIEYLADASNSILNADTYPPCLIDVPSPLLDG